MEFLSYPKISIHPNRNDDFKGPWIAQEKIHGAQLVIGVTTDEIHFGKRKSWLRPNDSFFGWQIMRPELEVLARSLYQAFCPSKKESLYIYGELCGGMYPYPDVLMIEGFSPVQTGVWYSPKLHWFPFDAVIVSSTKEEYFVNPLELIEKVKARGGLTPPIIHQGTRAELVNIPVRFTTKVPNLFGLSPIAQNWAEGLVLKPATSMPTSKRVVSKHKIEEFNEKRFDKSEAWDENQTLSLEGLFNLAIISINGPRIDSARSKVGDGSPNEIAEEVAMDILIDIREVYPKMMGSLCPLDEERLNRTIIEKVLEKLVR
jgi:Rnl2 family RNA ligase